MRRFVSNIAVLLLTLLLVAVARAEVNLLTMGDWGSDKPAQKEVAKALADYVQSSHAKFDGMLLAGDNFYVKLTGTDDPQWQTLFEEMYDPAILKFPFYVSLGNHDYQLGKSQIERDYAREHPESRWKMPSHYYRLEFPQDKPLVTVLMLDSNRQVVTDAEWNAETYWMEQELEKPRTSQWLVCCAHHPLFSNGDHGDNGVLQNTWGPLFRKYKVDLYICGHDHDVQHLEVPNTLTSFILVGGGGQSIRPMRVDVRGPFSKSTYGFAALNFTPNAMTVRLVSKDGDVLHTFRRTPDRHVEVVETTRSDPATPRTLKSIVRGGEETPATNPTTKPFKSEKSDD
jgi:hypothetical protein